MCQFTDEDSVRQHLLDIFVSSTYRQPQGGQRNSYHADQARRWLTFLAQHLEETVQSPDFAWWELRKAVPRRVVAAAVGLCCAIATALAIEIAFPVIGLVYFGLTHNAMSGLKLGLSGLRLGLKYEPAAAIGAALICGAAAFATHEDTQYHLARHRSYIVSMTAGLAFGASVGVAIWLQFTWEIAIAAGAGCTLAVTIATAIYARLGVSLRFRRGAFAGIAVGAVVGLTIAIIVGYFGGRTAGVHVGVSLGIVAGLTTAVVAMMSRDSVYPSRGLKWDFSRAALIGFAGLAVAGLAGAYSVPGEGVAYGVTLGLAFGLSGAIVAGIERKPDDLSAATGPEQVLMRDRTATRVLAVLAGVAGGVVAGLVTGVLYGLQNNVLGTISAEMAGGLPLGLAFGLALGLGVGVAAALTFGVAVSGFGTAWPPWLVARGWLAVRHNLPGDLVAFLADAHRRGVLRQAGAFYQFRHIELQHQLAQSTEDARPSERRMSRRLSTRTGRVLVAVGSASAIAAALVGSLVLAGVVPFTSRAASAVQTTLVPHMRVTHYPGLGATKQITLRPWVAGRLDRNAHVWRSVNGECFGSYISPRTDAYDCFTGNSDYSPCFASPDDFAEFFTHEGTLACPYPNSESIVLVRLTAPLHDANSPTAERSPWMLLLANGMECYYSGYLVEAGQLSGYCPEGGYLYGHVDSSRPAWLIRYRQSRRSVSEVVHIEEAIY